MVIGFPVLSYYNSVLELSELFGDLLVSKENGFRVTFHENWNPSCVVIVSMSAVNKITFDVTCLLISRVDEDG